MPHDTRWTRAGRQRLAHLRKMPQESIDELVRAFSHDAVLPKPDYHFRLHGPDLGAETIDRYLEMFRQHVSRSDLRLFTVRHPDSDSIMWFLVGIDNAVIAQYNETLKRYWSFYMQRDLPGLFEWVRGYWVQVVRVGDHWEFQLWK